MKNYPRIRRLSTLGIVHHQHFDYEFNPFRTDFVGEGGAGKSMISDLLQLICVGARAFHSPTKSTGPRKANTMVLKTEGRGTDMGYAFINIEKAENQYLAIGIYLESSNVSNMFIVQNGNNFDSDTVLMPFSNLLGVKDFQKNNTLLPINELKEHLQNSLNLTCESWDKTTNYHKILFNNNILPIDLSINYKTLENYAKIIQAFSRESLDTGKSASLQSFLFGDDKEKELTNKFYETIEELNDDTKQFASNLEEIDLLSKKQTQLSELLQLREILREDHEQFLIASYSFFNQQLIKTLTDLRNKINEYEFSLKTFSLLKTIIDKKLISIDKDLEELEPKWLEEFRTQDEWNTKLAKRKKFLSWMSAFNCSQEEIIEKYHKYHNSKESIDKINELQEKLKSKNVFGSFRLQTYSQKNVLTQIEKQIEKLKDELEIKNKLKSLNNIEDKHSLAHWALNLPSRLSQQQEAIIRKYQNEDIRVQEPFEKSKKYIPKPAELIKTLVPYKEDDNGFWLNLNGLIEFFSTDFSPIFDTNNTDQIKEYFQQETRSILKDISLLEKQIEEKIIFQDIFGELEQPDSYLQAWNSQSNLADQLETHEMYEMEKSDFLEYVDLYILNSIEESHSESKKKYTELDNEKSKLKILKDNLGREQKSFLNPTKIQKIEDIKLSQNFSDSNELNEEIFLSTLINSNDYYAEFVVLYNLLKSYYSQHGAIIHLDEEISEITLNKNNIYTQYPELFKNPIPNNDLTQKDITDLQTKQLSSKSEYVLKYNIIVNTFLSNKIKRFENTGDFQSLCEEILPSEILNDINVLEKEVIEKIEKYLRDINLKNKKLNNRKLQKLSVIVEEVANEVSEQKNDIRIIQNFLNADDKKITGGNKVSLDWHNENSYSPDWMNVFAENINKDLELGVDSLFESEKGISNDLEKYPSLAEKLLAAFYRSGGSSSLKPKIEELLNPKSYYGLKFSIKTNQGKKNDGSTSQTYSAIALLCMGKLSLINKHSKSKTSEAIRFMAIDEAEGLGSNFDMLYKIAIANDYQILSLSINPNKIDAGKQNIYLLHNSLEDEDVNYDPVPIFGI